MPNILIVCNTPSPNTHRLFRAAIRGASAIDTDTIQVKGCQPAEATSEDVMWCDGLLIGTTENFGYMSGAIKDFFERIYYPCLELSEGKPVAVYVKGGLDGQGAKASVERILAGLKWKLIAPVLVLTGDFREEFIAECKTLAKTLAAGIDAGIY